MTRPDTPQVVRATCATTVGEWLQVHSPNLGRVHVSCPVGWRTSVTVVRDEKGSGEATYAPESGEASPAEPLGEKSLEIIGKLCESLDIPRSQFSLSLRSQVPVGKGFASSTSDLVAIAAALGALAGQPLTSKEIHTLALAVEATDAIMYPGIVMAKLDHPVVLHTYAATPPVVFATINPPEILPTQDQPPSTAHPEANRMLAAMDEALSAQNLPAMARLATESAHLAQARITTPHLGLVEDICSEFDGLGIIIGHSGTLSAIICATTHPKHASRMDALVRTLEEETGCPAGLAHPDLAGPQTIVNA